MSTDTNREAERWAILSSLECDSQIGVPITAPRRARRIEHVRLRVEDAARARCRGDAAKCASNLEWAASLRRAIAEAPVMCAIGDDRIVSGPLGQRPPSIAAQPDTSMTPRMATIGN